MVLIWIFSRPIHWGSMYLTRGTRIANISIDYISHFSRYAIDSRDHGHLHICILITSILLLPKRGHLFTTFLFPFIIGCQTLITPTNVAIFLKTTSPMCQCNNKFALEPCDQKHYHFLFLLILDVMKEGWCLGAHFHVLEKLVKPNTLQKFGPPPYGTKRYTSLKILNRQHAQL